MTETVAVILQTNQLNWYIRHPIRFINALVSRINAGETDRYPGYARWHGDGVPGMQVIWIGNKNINGVISVGNGYGVKLGVTRGRNEASYEAKVNALKELADSMGYVLRKKPNNSHKTKKHNFYKKNK